MVKTTYPASSPSKYLIPKVTSIKTNSVVPEVKEIIKEAAIKSLLNYQFEIYGECNTEQETQPKPELKLASEVAINELICEALKAILATDKFDKFEVGSGFLDETPPKHQPFYRYLISKVLHSIICKGL